MKREHILLIPLIGLIYFMYLDFRKFNEEQELEIERPPEMKIAGQLLYFFHTAALMLIAFIIIAIVLT